MAAGTGTAAEDAEMDETPDSDETQIPHTPWGGVRQVDRLGGVDPTLGNDNTVARATVRRFGEMGVVTSQRSHELSLLHVHDGGLIGLDNACVHGEEPPQSL